MRRRTVLASAALGMSGLAGCSSDDSGAGPTGTPSGTGTPTETPTAEPTPSATPACSDTTADDTGEFSFEYGVTTEDDERYDATLRIVHVRTPRCRYEEPACEAASTETVLAEETYRVIQRTKFDIVDAPVTADVDSYRLEWTVGDRTDTSRGLEQAARSTVGEPFDFYVCDPGARRFGFVVRDGAPVIVRAGLR